MPKQYYIIRDFSGGINTRKDPRDLNENESSFIQNMSVDALGKIKTVGKMYAHVESQDGDTNLSEYIVQIDKDFATSGGYGLTYFESDHSKDSEQTITNTQEFIDSTCDLTNDPTVVHNANSRIAAGLSVSGAGVPTGATISSITDSTHFELSASTTGGNELDVALTFTRALALGETQASGNISFSFVPTSPDEGPAPDSPE